MIAKLAYGFVSWQLTRLPNLQPLKCCGMLLVAFKAFIVLEHCQEPEINSRVEAFICQLDQKVQHVVMSGNVSAYVAFS